MRGERKSFIVQRNVKTAIETTAGLIHGISTRNRVFKVPQPSIRAASSNSLGTLFRTWIRMNTNIPSQAQREGRVSGIYVSRRPRLLQKRYIGMIVTIDGMSIPHIRSAKKNFFIGKSNRAKP